jgi:protein TonB
MNTVLSMLLSWTAQVLILVIVAAISGRALAHPRARLFFWQFVLLIVLLLPVVQPWKASPIEAISASASVIVHVAPAGNVALPWYSRVRWKPQYLAGLLVAGAILRLLWIGVGFARLRRYRKNAELMKDPPLYFVAQSVRWYLSNCIPGPVTYGWLKPSILLPQRTLALAPAMREAIACHELVHVQRGDWLFVISEEVVRSLLWFHPAVWYVLSQIQLAREQVVDREAVRLTDNRECYLDALMAVAGHKLQPDLVPATLFLKKRHLTVRVAEVMKEVSMSRARIAASLTAVFSAALFAVFMAVWLFPMVSPAQTVVDDPGVTVDAGGKLLHRGPVHYPLGQRAGGTVTIDATLNSKGEVTDARVLTGPEELRKSALAAVLDWHYSTERGTLSHAQISIRFEPRAGSSETAATTTPVPPPAPPPPGFSRTIRIKSLEFVGVSPEAEQELRNRIQFHEGDVINPPDMLKINQAVQEYDSHLRAGFTTGNLRPGQEAEAVLRITLVQQANGSIGLPAVVGGRGPVVTTQTIPAPAPLGTIRVGGDIQSTKIVSKATPVYPPLAKQARIQGTVKLAVTIGADGTVQDIQTISGHPLLVDPAIDAVKQWVYQPTLLNGNPVSVITEVNVNFTLAQ